MGGTGYFGVLSIMWILYPLLLRKINTREEAIKVAIIVICCSYIAYGIIREIAIVNADSRLLNWGWYINRGVYSFSLGSVLYFIYSSSISQSERNKTETTGNRLTRISLYCALAFICFEAYSVGNQLDGLLFTIVWSCIISLARFEKTKLIDNKVWSFFGKYITELFVSHIVLFYTLVQNHHLLNADITGFFILLFASIILAPILYHVVTKPCARIKGVLKTKSSLSIVVLFVCTSSLIACGYSCAESDMLSNDIQNDFEHYFESNNTERKVLKVGREQEYLTISSAVNMATDGDTILVYPGEYNESIRMSDRDLKIIGLDRDRCIISYDNGDYSRPPIEMTKGLLMNITIHAYHCENPKEEKSYAFHCDFQGRGIVGGGAPVCERFIYK